MLIRSQNKKNIENIESVKRIRIFGNIKRKEGPCAICIEDEKMSGLA